MASVRHPVRAAGLLLDRGPAGRRRAVQNFLNFGNPAQPHDTSGYPKLTAWGAGNLTYEGTYWRWIQRAWMGGLRLMVMSVNENRVLCELQANRKTNCDEMDTVRRGFEDIRELQRYVDAQAGGPGKGFFQIVTDPLRGAARDQRGQDGGRPRDRGLRAVRLPRLGPRRRATRRRSTAQLDEMYRARRALVAAAQQVRQPADRRALRQRADRRADQRRPTSRAPAPSGARRPAPARCTTTRSRRSTPQPAARSSTRCSAAIGVAERHGPRLSAGPALQHARADRRSGATSSSG